MPETIEELAESNYGSVNPEGFYRVHVEENILFGCDPEVYFKTLHEAYDWIVTFLGVGVDRWGVEDIALEDVSVPPPYELIRYHREDLGNPPRILGHFHDDAADVWNLNAKIFREVFTTAPRA